MRALAPPWAGAFSELADGRLFVWRSRPHDAGVLAGLEPGEIARRGERFFAGAGEGVLELVEHAAPSGRALRAGERAGSAQEATA